MTLEQNIPFVTARSEGEERQRRRPRLTQTNTMTSEDDGEMAYLLDKCHHEKKVYVSAPYFLTFL